MIQGNINYIYLAILVHVFQYNVQLSLQSSLLTWMFSYIDILQRVSKGKQHFNIDLTPIRDQKDQRFSMVSSQNLVHDLGNSQCIKQCFHNFHIVISNPIDLVHDLGNLKTIASVTRNKWTITGVSDNKVALSLSVSYRVSSCYACLKYIYKQVSVRATSSFMKVACLLQFFS